MSHRFPERWQRRVGGPRRNGPHQRRIWRGLLAERVGFDEGTADAMLDAEGTHPLGPRFSPFQKRKYQAAWHLGYVDGWSK